MASVFGRAVGVALIVGVPALTSCGMGKIAECNKLIQTANAQQEGLKKATTKLKDSQSNPSEIENMASTFDNSAKAIGAVELKDEKLKQLAKDYQDLLKRAGKNSRDMAAALRRKDNAAMTRASTALNTVGPDESKVVSSINDYCQGR